MATKKNKNKNLIAFIIFFLIILLVCVSTIIIKKKRTVPANSPETVGNTSGNLNNMGYFCEKDGIVYFANYEDNYYLYSMDPVSLEAKRIADVPVAYLNAAGDYIYYYYNDRGEAKFMGVAGNMRGIYRVKASGKDTPTCLDRTTSGIVSLIGNDIFYQHYDNSEGMTLYKASIDGKNKEQVSKEIINPSCIINGNIYYPDQNNMFYLNVFYPGNSFSELYVKERMYNPVYSGDYIYYQNVDDNYCLYRYNYYEQSTTKLTKERIDLFNVYGDYIFFQTNSKNNARLVRMRTDGSNPEVIAMGNFTEINCTSTYTYFRLFDDENMFYMTPTMSDVYVSEFHPVVTGKK